MNNYNQSARTFNMQNSSCSPCNQHVRAERTDSSCACTKTRFPAATAYAMAYVPFQQSGEVYSCDRALTRGTIFPCLDLPFLRGCCK